MHVKERKSWNDADEACKNKGGFLASIHTKDENDFIHSTFLLNHVLENFMVM